jgi:hypothetical protein
MQAEQLDRILQMQNDFNKLGELDHLFQQTQSGLSTVAENVPTLVGAIKSERWEPAKSRLWLLLSYAPADDRVLDFAKETLENPRAFGRGTAVDYIYKNYRDLRPFLAEYLSDGDPAVAFGAGEAILDSDPAKAVKTWLAWLDRGVPTGMAEGLIMRIANHGDVQVGEQLAERDRVKGGNTTWGMMARQIANWHSVEYLSGPPSPVEDGRDGFWIPCPNCKWLHGIRLGHEGEEVRCKKCGTVFRVAAPPKR